MQEIRLNVFEMNCVGHQSPGLWAHPRDRSANYTDLDYWTSLARTLERGRFDGIFLADVLGIYDVYGGSPDAALRHAVQVPVNDPVLLIPAMAADRTSRLRRHLDAVLRAALSVRPPHVDLGPSDQGAGRLEHRHRLSRQRRRRHGAHGAAAP